MMRSVISRKFWMGGSGQMARDHKARSRRLEAVVEDLESRNLMTAGSVVQSGAQVNVTPAPTGPNVAIVSYQNVNGTTMLDVNLNGADNYFSLAQVGFVFYMGMNASGDQTFENNTNLYGVGWGGSGNNLFVSTTSFDEFFGGSGSNTFDAGSGFDLLIGGTGPNVFNENATGSGLILEVDGANTLNVAPGSSGGNYGVY